MARRLNRALPVVELLVWALIAAVLVANAATPPTLAEVTDLFAEAFSCRDDAYFNPDYFTVGNTVINPLVQISDELLIGGNSLQNLTEDSRTRFLLRKAKALGQFRIQNNLNHNNTCFLPPQCNQFYRPTDVITGADPTASGITFEDTFDEAGFFRELDLYRARIRLCSGADAASAFHLATGAAAVHGVACAALSTRLGRYPIETNPMVRDEILGFFQFASAFSSNRSVMSGGFVHADRVARRLIAQYSRTHIVSDASMPLLGESYFRDNLQQVADNMKDALGSAQLTNTIQTAVTNIDRTTTSVGFAVASLSSANAISSVRTMTDALVSTQQNQILALTQNLEEEWARLSGSFGMVNSKNITRTFENLRNIVRDLNDDLANICRSEAILLLVFAVLIEAAKAVFSFGFATVALSAVSATARAVQWAVKSAKTAQRAKKFATITSSRRAKDFAEAIEYAEDAVELGLTLNAASQGDYEPVPAWEALTDPLSAALNVADLETQIQQKKAQNERIFSRIGELVLGFVDQATAMRSEFQALATFVANREGSSVIIQTDSDSYLRVSVAQWRFYANELRDVLVRDSGGICLNVPSAGSSTGRRLNNGQMKIETPVSIHPAQSSNRDLMSMMVARSEDGSLGDRNLQGCLNQKDRSRLFAQARKQCDGAMQEVFDYADLMQTTHNQLIRVVELHRQIAVAKLNSAQIRSGYEDFSSEVNQNAAQFRAEVSREALMRLMGSRQVKSYVQLDMVTILDVVSENVEEACLAFKYFYPGRTFAISSTQYNSFFSINQTTCSVSFSRSDVLTVNMESLLSNAVSGLTVLRNAQYLSAARRDAVERPAIKTLACELNLADVERDATSVAFQVLPFSVVDEDGLLCDENQELQFAYFVPVNDAEKPYRATASRGRLSGELTGPLLKAVGNREYTFGAGTFRFNTDYDVAGCDGSASDVSTRINHRGTIETNICDGVSLLNTEWARPSPFGLWNVSLRVSGSNLLRDSTKLIAIFRTVSRSTDSIRCQSPGWPTGVFNTSVRTCLPIGTGVSLKAAELRTSAASDDSGSSVLGIALGTLGALGVLTAATVAIYKSRHPSKTPSDKHTSLVPQNIMESANPMAEMTGANAASSVPPSKVDV